MLYELPSKRSNFQEYCQWGCAPTRRWLTKGSFRLMTYQKHIESIVTEKPAIATNGLNGVKSAGAKIRAEWMNNLEHDFKKQQGIAKEQIEPTEQALVDRKTGTKQSKLF